MVSALTHIVEGSTCGIVLRDCSPARSSDYSSYDMSESLELSDASPELELQGEDGSVVYAGHSPITLRPPPSPPTG